MSSLAFLAYIPILLDNRIYFYNENIVYCFILKRKLFIKYYYLYINSKFITFICQMNLYIIVLSMTEKIKIFYAYYNNI